MLLKCFNRKLIEDREKTFLTAAAGATATTLTVAGVDTNAWADNDYLIVGEIGQPTAEIMQVNGAVSDGTSLTIDRSGAAGGLRFAHSAGEPVYRIDFNRVEFSQNSTATTDGATVLATIEIQPDDEFTRYEDTTNTTGYGFVRFNNQTTGTFSAYSPATNYDPAGEASSYDPRTLWVMRRKTRRLLEEDRPDSRITDRQIDEALNDRQRDVAHLHLWSFYETERSFSAVADQFAYTLPNTVQKVHQVLFDTQPLIYVPHTKWKLLHWDSNAESSKPTHYSVWNREILIWPRPSAAASTTTINQGGGISATATSVTVTATSAFNRGDYYRFIIDSEVIYATESTSTSFTGLLRGREGTTAATHANGATITERDITYTAHVEPTDLIDTQDRTAVPEPDILVLGAAIDLAPLAGKESLIPSWTQSYEKKIKNLEDKFGAKQTAQSARVKSRFEVYQDRYIYNPNDYPRDITGT